MTHPLTPREKVAAVVLDAAAAYLIQQYGASHGLDHEIDRARIMSAIPNDAILTALASGSGDHAELARLADMADWMADGDSGANGSVLLSASVASEHASDMKALLAENAALRERLETARFARVEHNRQYEELRSRATEAERKLAEAVQVIRDVAETPYTGTDWPRSRAATYLASKEAERE